MRRGIQLDKKSSSSEKQMFTPSEPMEQGGTKAKERWPKQTSGNHFCPFVLIHIFFKCLVQNRQVQRN